MLYLKFVHFFEGLERDFQFLFLSHSVLKVITTISEVKLANFPELLLDADELLNYDMCVVNLLLEDFDFVGYVVATASV